MKEPYSKTKYLSVRIRAALDLFRPFTLLAPFFVSMSIMTASLIYSKVEIPANWWVIIGQASITVTIVNAASNSLNQATDVESDKISKPYRPIPQGFIKKDEAQSLAYLLYLFALLRAITITPNSIWFGVFIFLIIIFTITYSLPPRMKKYLFINQLWIAIPRGLLGILAAWSVFGNPFTPVPLIIGLAATIYLIGGMATKDITDSAADKRTGVRTLINTYGEKKTALICFPFMFFSFVFVFVMIERNILKGYLWPLLLLSGISFFIIYLMLRSKESKTLENVHAWSIMYIQYIMFALGFALLTIFGEMGNL